MNNSKLNNYHFGRQVFEYFPWYDYTNVDIESMPKLNDSMRRDFNFAFDDNDSGIYVWIKEHGHIYSTIDSGYMDSNILSLRRNIAKYRGMEETIESWEDIEKIRLRCILGTREKAEAYMKVIDLYTSYHDLISDMVYTQSGEEIEVSVIGIGDFIHRDNQEVCMSFIEDSDVYECLKNNVNSSFLHSVYGFYSKNGFLTPKQIAAVRKSLPKHLMEQLSKKNLTFLYVKTNNIPNINRVTDYLSEIKLKFKIFNNFILIY